MKEYRKYKVTIEYQELIKITCNKCKVEILQESRKVDKRFERTRLLCAIGEYEKGWKIGDLCDKCVEQLKKILEEMQYATP